MFKSLRRSVLLISVPVLLFLFISFYKSPIFFHIALFIPHQKTSYWTLNEIRQSDISKREKSALWLLAIVNKDHDISIFALESLMDRKADFFDPTITVHGLAKILSEETRPSVFGAICYTIVRITRDNKEKLDLESLENQVISLKTRSRRLAFSGQIDYLLSVIADIRACSDK